MKDLLDGFFKFHEITCPCGASLKTDRATVVELFIREHKDHSPATPITPAGKPTGGGSGERT